MLAVCSTAADTLLIHHVLFENCRSLRLLLLHFSSCSTCSVRPAGHSTAKINKIRPFHPEKTNFAYFAHLSQRFLHANAYSSTHDTFLSLSTTSNSLIFTWKTLSRPSGNPKELLSIAATTHILCHCSGTKEGSRNNTFSSDLATSSEIATPNKSSDPSFHQVLQIYLLSKSVPTPISVDYTSEQVDASIIALQAIIYIHPCISSILFITQKNTALHKLQEFISLSIHFDCCILFI